MGVVGQTRSIQFWIVDINSVPVTDCTLGSFVITFTRSGTACADPLTLVDAGAGVYFLRYTPSAPGTDSFVIDDNVHDLHYYDVEDITWASGGGGGGGDGTSFIVTVNQDYGGAGKLRPTLVNLSTFTLYAFLDSDWSIGNSDPAFARGSYRLDSTGDWSLDLLPNVYDLVLMDHVETTVVFAVKTAVGLGS